MEMNLKHIGIIFNNFQRERSVALNWTVFWTRIFHYDQWSSTFVWPSIFVANVFNDYFSKLIKIAYTNGSQAALRSKLTCSRHGYALDGTPQHNDHQNNNASSFTMKFYLKVRYKDLKKNFIAFKS